MSETPAQGTALAWTLGDRLGKAMRVAGISAAEMAEYLDVHRNTVSAYINDRQPPKRSVLRLWALRTGVSLDWLETGESPVGPPPGGGEQAGTDRLAQLTRAKLNRSPRQRRPNAPYVAAVA